MARKSFDDILKEHERDKTNRTYSNTAKNMPSTKSNINNDKRKSFDDILSEHNKNKQINQQAYQERQRQKQIQQNPQQSYLYAPDYQKFSSMGANIKNPSFNEATGTMSLFGWQPFAKDIKNRVTYSRDNAALLAMDSHKDNRYDPKYSFMTDDEVGIYNYLLAKDGEEMADKYLKDLDKSLNERSMKRYSEETKKLSDENKVAGTALNLGMSMFTPGAFIATAGQSAKNAITGSKDTLDPNSRAFGAVAIEQASREGLKEDTGAVGDFLIDTGLSMGQFATKLPFGGTAALGMMGTGAAGQTSKDILDRGGTQKQAMLGGTVAGVAEVIFEKFSLDQLKAFKNLPATTLKGLLNNVLKGAFVEGSEEVGTEIVNTIADKIIMGDLSQYDISVRNYIGQGMSQKEAENKAKWDIAKNIGLSFAGGALSGGVLGAGANIIGNYQQGRTFTDTNTVQDLINEGLASEQNTQAYKSAVNLQNKLNTGQRITNIEVGLQQNANEEAISQEETTEQQDLTQQENNYIQSENQPITNNNDMRRIERVQVQPNNTQNINPIPSNLSENEVLTNQRMEYMPNENISAIRPIKATEPLTKARATFINSDAQVTVKGINSISENGNVIVNIEDGNNSTVANLEDVAFNNPETAQVYGMASSYDSNGAKAFISGYNGSLDIDSYAKGFNQYYNGGKTNLDINVINKTSAYSSILPIQTRLQAYYAGKNDATAQIELRQKKATESKQISKQSETKLLKPMNNVSEEEAVIMTYVSKATGVKVVIDEDIEGANGYYKDGEIHISSKADNKALVVFSHELTHYMEDSSPELWKDYRDYVINYMKSEHTEEYNKLTEHIKNLYKENGLDITDESIMNEISANATEEFLTDADAIQKLVNENRSIAEKIFDTLKRFIEVIKSKFSDYTATSTEGKLLRKNLDVLENARKLWMKALDNTRGMEYTIDKNNSGVSGMSYSIKDNKSKKLLEERLSGDSLLDAQDLIEEIKSIGGAVDEYGYVTVYHRTSKNNSDSILETKIMKAKEDGLFFSTKISGYNDGYGDSLVTLSIPAEKLVIDDVFDDEIHLRYPLGKNRNLNVSEYLKTDNNSNAASLKDSRAKYSIKDSEGNTLSKEQQEYFKDSKVRDENGNLKIVYHGSGNDFTKFSYEFIGTNGTSEGKGFYFTDKKDIASGYGEKGKVYEVYLDIKKPLNTTKKRITKIQLKKFIKALDPTGDDFLSNYGDVNYDGYNNVLNEAINSEYEYSDNDVDLIAGIANSMSDSETVNTVLRETLGYDGIIENNATWGDGQTIYIAFNSNQVKNIDNTSPTKDDDIRFSLKDTSDVDTKRLTEENQNINVASELLKEQFSLTKNYIPDDIAIKKLANKLLKDYNSSYDKNTLEENLKSLFGYISNSETSFYDDAIEAAAGMAKRIIQTSNQLDNTFSEQYAELRKDLRTTGISLSEEAKKEIAYHYGSYNEFRKKYFGKIRFTNDGINLDSYWGELSSKYPELFDSETNELEQALRLAEALEITDPFLNNSFGMDTDALAQELALNIFNEYLKTPALHNNQMAKLRKEYDNKIKDIQKYYYNRYQEQYSKLANTTNDKLAKQKAKFVQKNAESRNTRKQREAIKKYKTRIEKNSKDLTTWITHPTDAKHVPEVLKRTVLEFLTSLDLTSNRLNNKGELTRKSIKWNDAMENLRRILSDMETVSGEGETGSTYQDFYMDIDPELISRLDAFVGGNKQYENINNMNAEQLKEVDYLVSVVKKAVTEANKLKANAKYQTIVELGNSSIGELNSMKSRKLHSDLVNKLDKFVNLDQMDSFSYFESLGSSATTIQNELRKGHDKHTININQTLEYMNELKKDTDTSKWTGKSATVKTFNIKGKEVKMTIGQIMELYQLNKREQARGHIYGGGIKILDVIGKEEQSKGKIKIRQLKPIQLSKDDVNMVINSLSDDQKRIADGMQEFMSNQAAEWGNETSLQMYGYKKFTEENYYPIKSDDNYTITNDQNSTAGQLYAIKNLGMTKATVKNANNPLMIGDIFDTFTRHVTEMSTYNAFLIPLSDTMKWYNYKSKSDGIYHGSVKEGIQRIWNNDGKAYLVNLIKDINGVSQSGYGTELFTNIISNMKVASVGANLRVVLQQPTAYLRATYMINPKYLIMGLGKKPQVSKANKYAPIALWKSWGFFDLNTGRSMKSIITGERSMVENVREKSLSLAGMMDDITWGTLWNAVEFETKSTHPQLKYGSEEFNKAVGERLSEIVDRTQVVDTVLHRSQMMRSKDLLVKTSTAFMSEPNKNYNLMRNAIVNAMNSKSKESYKKLYRATMAIVLSNVAASAAAAISDMLRDKDKDRKWENKYIESLKSNISDNLNPLNTIPVARDIMSIVDGFAPSRMDMSAISNLILSINELIKWGQGDSKKSNYAVFSQTSKAMSQMFGIPAGNLLREFESIYNLISEEGIDMESDTANSKKTYKSMYEALINGDKSKYDKLLNHLLKNEKTTDSIDSGLRKALVDNDPRIEEAAKARQSGNITKYKSLVNEMKAQGFKQDVVVTAINSYINSLKPKKDEVKETGYNTEDGTKSIYEYNDLYTAIDNNNTSSIVEIRDIMIESGKELKSIRSQITEKYKPLYQEYYNNGDTKKAEQIKDTLISYFGYEEDTFTEWEGITTGNMAKALIDGDINKVIEIRDSKLSGLEGDEYKQKLGSLKSSLTSKVKPVYVDYYLNGEYDSMDELKVLLMDYFGYEEKTIDKWLEG